MPLFPPLGAIMALDKEIDKINKAPYKRKIEELEAENKKLRNENAELRVQLGDAKEEAYIYKKLLGTFGGEES